MPRLRFSTSCLPLFVSGAVPFFLKAVPFFSEAVPFWFCSSAILLHVACLQGLIKEILLLTRKSFMKRIW